MTPSAKFLSLRIQLFGKYGGQIRCARFLKKPDGTHVNVSTVRRWEKGEHPVPVGVMEMLRAELKRRRKSAS